MKKYAIRNAIANTKHRPNLPFGGFFYNNYEFHATDDEDALLRASILQQHCGYAYLNAGASRVDFWNSPRYADHLYEITKGSEYRKVIYE